MSTIEYKKSLIEKSTIKNSNYKDSIIKDNNYDYNIMCNNIYINSSVKNCLFNTSKMENIELEFKEFYSSTFSLLQIIGISNYQGINIKE